jgi:hypothetical protein
VIHVSGGDDLQVGEFAWVTVDRHDDHDLYGRLVGKNLSIG